MWVRPFQIADDLGKLPNTYWVLLQPTGPPPEPLRMSALNRIRTPEIDTTPPIKVRSGVIKRPNGWQRGGTLWAAQRHGKPVVRPEGDGCRSHGTMCPTVIKLLLAPLQAVTKLGKRLEALGAFE